jgi:hypothetical protein
MWTAELIGPVSRVMLSVLSWLVRHPLGSERRPGQPAPAPWLMLRRRADRVGAGGSLPGCSAGWSLRSEHIAGHGPPSSALTATEWELFRALSSRRSPAQIRSLRWSGDAEAYLPLLPAYGLPRNDLIE